MDRIYVLPDQLDISEEQKKLLIEDYNGLDYKDIQLEAYILERYGVDVSASYGNIPLKNPFGKASGQLSCKIGQVEKDAKDGLGFVVLKTVISQDQQGNSGMEAWKVKAPKMVVEEITSKRGETGYTVTWKGRGWDKSFEDYLELVKEGYQVGNEHAIPVIPSVKYQLPDGQEPFKEEEYTYTTEALLSLWKQSENKFPFVIEKDFSPTLAGSDKSTKPNLIRWIREVPAQIKKYIDVEDSVIGVKLLNTLYEDEFQLEMVKAATSKENAVSADILTCFNRLFDLEKVFEDKKGVSVGGYDLSDRNLKVLTEFLEIKEDYQPTPFSATGNIDSGKMMVEYALRGATCGQLHTYFQIPSKNYVLQEGSRIRRALHELMFNPMDGLVVSMLYLKKRLGLKDNEVMKFLDIQQLYKKVDLFKDL